jgi:GAF domain-containing protein
MNQGCREIVAAYGPVVEKHAVGQRYPWAPGRWGEWSALWKSRRKPFLLLDVEGEDWFIENYRNESFRSWMGIPVMVRDKVYGLIQLDHRKPKFYTEEHTALAQSFANQAGVAIEKTLLYQAALRAAERRAVLHRISQDIVRFRQDS